MPVHSPVHWNTTKVQNTSGGEIDVQTVPEIAHEGSEQPLPGQLHRRIERHGTEGDQHVCQSQRHYEVIGDHPVDVEKGLKWPSSQLFKWSLTIHSKISIIVDQMDLILPG